MWTSIQSYEWYHKWISVRCLAATESALGCLLSCWVQRTSLYSTRNRTFANVWLEVGIVQMTLQLAGVKMWPVRHADIVTRRILTVRGWLKSISTVFHRGGSKPEVVFQSDSRCGGRDLSTDCNWAEVGPVEFVVAHISAPDDNFRSAKATVENAWNRLAIRLIARIHRKTAFHAFLTAQKRHLHVWAATLANNRTRLDQPHPRQVCDLWDMRTELLDGFWLSGAGSVDFDRIPPWRVVLFLLHLSRTCVVYLFCCSPHNIAMMCTKLQEFACNLKNLLGLPNPPQREGATPFPTHPTPQYGIRPDTGAQAQPLGFRCQSFQFTPLEECQGKWELREWPAYFFTIQNWDWLTVWMDGCVRRVGRLSSDSWNRCCCYWIWL